MFKRARGTPHELSFVAAAKAATTWNDFVRGKRRKALRRCPDMSRKRDGIVVSALSFLLSPRLFSACFQSTVIGREDRRLRHARREERTASPGRGVMPTSQSMCQ